jgi:hypothetical protein
MRSSAPSDPLLAFRQFGFQLGLFAADLVPDPFELPLVQEHDLQAPVELFQQRRPPEDETDACGKKSDQHCGIQDTYAFDSHDPEARITERGRHGQRPPVASPGRGLTAMITIAQAVRVERKMAELRKKSHRKS